MMKMRKRRRVVVMKMRERRRAVVIETRKRRRAVVIETRKRAIGMKMRKRLVVMMKSQSWGTVERRRWKRTGRRIAL